MSGNNAGAAARSKIGLSKWDILAFKCATRMGVFALILSSLSLRQERMEKTGMFSRGVKPGPGLLRMDWGWEVLDAVLGVSAPSHIIQLPRQCKRMFFRGGHGVSLCTAKAVAGKGRVSLSSLDSDEGELSDITDSPCKLTACFVLFLIANSKL